MNKGSESPTEFKHITPKHWGLLAIGRAKKRPNNATRSRTCKKYMVTIRDGLLEAYYRLTVSYGFVLVIYFMHFMYFPSKILAPVGYSKNRGLIVYVIMSM